MSKAEKQTAQTYETAMRAVEDMLARLGGDDITLEEAIALYGQAAEQLTYCDKTLREAALRIETIDAALAALQKAGDEDDED